MRQQCHVVLFQVKDCSEPGPRRHHANGHGKLGDEPGCRQDDHQRTYSKKQGNRVDLPGSLQDMPYKLRRFSCFRLSSHKLGDLHQDDLNTDTADKSPHHRRGDEIHDPACLQKIEQQKPQAGKQRHHRHKGHGFRRAAHNAKRGDRRPRQRCRRGVHPQDELPGPGDCRKDDDGEHRPVQTIHRRQAGHFRITHGNGNGYRRYDDPHENIFRKVSPGISSQRTKQPFRLFLLHFLSLILPL